MNFLEEFKNRNKNFALRIINLYQNLPKTGEAKIIGNQVLRSGTSVAANYRADAHARSEKNFMQKYVFVLKKLMKLCFG